jgi:hypothetical protein
MSEEQDGQARVPKKTLQRAAKTLSRAGASKGGKARFAKLTAEERSAVAKHAVEARWAKVRAAREALDAEDQE